MVVIKANITPGDELQTPHSWKVIAGSSQPPHRKRTIFFDQKGRRRGKKRGPYKELKAEKGEPTGPRVGGDVSW